MVASPSVGGQAEGEHSCLHHGRAGPPAPQCVPMDVTRTQPDQVGEGGSRWTPRRIAFVAASWVFAAGAFGGLLGLGIVIGWFDRDEGGIHRVHEIGFGVLYGVILTAACIGLTRRPERRASAFYQVVATAMAALIAVVISSDGRYLLFVGVVGTAAVILLALHPARATVLRPSLDPSPLLGAIALAGSIPLVWFALTMARMQRTGFPADPHVANDHWANMAAMAFGLVLTGLVASIRLPGWRLSAWCAGIGVAVYGVASIIFDRFPGTSVPYPGSEGIGWGLVAVIGGLAFVAAAEWEAAGQRGT